MTLHPIPSEFPFFKSVQPSVCHSIGGVMLRLCLDLTSYGRCQDSYLSLDGGIVNILYSVGMLYSLGCNDLYINNGTNCSETLLTTPSHLTPFLVRCRLALPLFQPLEQELLKTTALLFARAELSPSIE